MKIFSEIYNKYFYIIRYIINRIIGGRATKADMNKAVAELGFAESSLFLSQKLESGNPLISITDNQCKTKITDTVNVPLTSIQKAWLKSVLNNEKASLFVDRELIDKCLECLKDVEPIFSDDNFYYYDRYFTDDDFSDKTYTENFRIVLNAVKEKTFIKITLKNDINMLCLPCRIEYSVKNNKFRIIGVSKNHKFIVINISGIKKVKISTRKDYDVFDINTAIRNNYYPEPVTVIIRDERKALERAMFQFANYEKNTVRLEKNIYRCEIYYNRAYETELLVEILSFGPLIRVTGNECFLELLKSRIRNQKIINNLIAR